MKLREEDLEKNCLSLEDENRVSSHTKSTLEVMFKRKYLNLKFLSFNVKKSHIRETLTLSMCADNSISKSYKVS